MALSDMKAKTLAEGKVNANNPSQVQSKLNDTVIATMSVNKKIREQAVKELALMKGVVTKFGKSLGSLQKKVIENLDQAVEESEKRQEKSNASALRDVSAYMAEQAAGLTRTVLSEYSKKNPLVYTGMKLFDSISANLNKKKEVPKKADTKKTPIVPKETAPKPEPKETNKEPDDIKLGLEKLQESNVEQVNVLKEIRSIIVPENFVKESEKDVVESEQKEPIIVKVEQPNIVPENQKTEAIPIKVISEPTPEPKKPVVVEPPKEDKPLVKDESKKDEKSQKLTRQQLADLNKESRKQTKIQKTAERHALQQAKATASIVKIEKERLLDESKMALLEKTKVEEAQPSIQKSPVLDKKEVDNNIMGQVFAGTFLGELVEHLVGRTLGFLSKGLFAAVKGLFSAGSGAAKIVGGVAGTIIKRFLLPLTVGLAAWDGWKLATDDKKISKLLDKEAKDISMTDRVVAGATGFASSIIGGTIDSITSIFGVDFNIEGKMNSFILGGYKKITDFLTGLFDRLFDFSDVEAKIGADTTFADKIFVSITNAATAGVGMILGVFDSMFGTNIKEHFKELKDSFVAMIIRWKNRAINEVKSFFGFDTEEKPEVTKAKPKDNVVPMPAKPKAETAVNNAKQVEAKQAQQATLNNNATAINQVSQKTNINNNVFQNKNISPRNTDDTVRVLSYR